MARRAGVSRATVSYVLNDVPHQSIPDATRQRVLAAAEELGYTPHAAARTLRAGESRLVCSSMPASPTAPTFPPSSTPCSAEAAASGRSLVVWQQHDPDDLAATLTHLQPAMTITLGRLNEDQRELLARARIPSVETDTGRRPGRRRHRRGSPGPLPRLARPPPAGLSDHGRSEARHVRQAPARRCPVGLRRTGPGPASGRRPRGTRRTCRSTSCPPHSGSGRARLIR